MWAYLIHYIFISLATKLIIEPTELGEIAIIIILYIVSEICVFASYFAIVKASGLCKKERNEKINDSKKVTQEQ